MTIAQDRYFDAIDNPDKSKTLVGIVEFEADGENMVCLFRFHGSTVLISDLYGSHLYSDGIEIACNLIWQKYIESTGVNPAKINWIKHEGPFSGRCGRIDIRNPFSDRKPRDGKVFNEYCPVLLDWSSNKFILANVGNICGRDFSEEESEPYSHSNFSSVEAITHRFNWTRNLNRLDIDYIKEQKNNDGTTTIKNIYFWENFDYPSHCLVRIWIKADEAIVILSELVGNIPPFQCEYFGTEKNGRKVTNRASDFFAQIINGIQRKFYYELSHCKSNKIVWIYEWGEFSSNDERKSHGIYGSSFDYIELSSNQEGELKTTLDSISDNDTNMQNVLRGEAFGNVQDSLQELGWRHGA
jgi:hypothetical protein